MFKKNNLLTSVWVGSFAGILCLGNLAEAASEATIAKAIVSSAPNPAGLCVQVGCGDGKLTAELAKAGKLIVQGLSNSKDDVAKARAHLQSLGIYGKASVEFSDLKKLPYAESIVNLLVIEDFPKASNAGLSLKEAMRVVCPKSVALVAGLSERKLKSELAKAGMKDAETAKQDGGWLRITKPWPEGMGEWRSRKPSGGSVVSADTIAGPPGRVRWMCPPRWYFPGTMAPLVSAGGRLYYGGTLPPFEGVRGPAEPLLIARDGFNGLLLWSLPFPALETQKGKRGPQVTVVAGEDRVFAILKSGEPLTAIDARTGKKLKTYKELGVPQQVICHKDVLILKGGGGIHAFDAFSGKQLWTRKDSARSILAGEGKLFFQVGGALLCVDATSGKDLWRAENPGGGPRFYSKGVLVCASGNSGTGISAKDGKTLWTSQGPWGSATAYDELCWSYKRGKGRVKGSGEYIGLDPRDGKEKKRVPHLNRGST